MVRWSHCVWEAAPAGLWYVIESCTRFGERRNEVFRVEHTTLEVETRTHLGTFRFLKDARQCVRDDQREYCPRT